MAGAAALWAGAGLTGALLTAAHGKGILILVPLLWEAWPRQTRGGARGNVSVTLVVVDSAAGLISFAAYLHFRFGDALAFLHGQEAFHRELAAPWEGMEIASRYPAPYGHFFIGMVMAAFGLCSLLRGSVFA